MYPVKLLLVVVLSKLSTVETTDIILLREGGLEMSIGQRIRQRRRELKMSQEELAKLIGTTKQTVYKYERGIITNIPLERIQMLAIALRTSQFYLLGNDLSFGEILRVLRNDKKMTKEELANRIGVSSDKIEKWESGAIKNVTGSELAQLAEALGVTQDHLLGRAADPEASRSDPVPVYLHDGTMFISSEPPDVVIAELLDERAARTLLEAVREICTSTSHIKAPSGLEIPFIDEDCLSVVIDFLKRNADLLRTQIESKKTASRQGCEDAKLAQPKD